MSDLLLGVDVGTSGCKATLLRAEDGRILATRSESYQPLSPRPGWMEQDPATWYAAMCHAIRALLAEHLGSTEQLRGLGIAGQMRGLALVSGDGTLVRPVILWNDIRCSAEVDGIVGPDLEQLSAVTRNVLNTMCTLARARTMLFPKDYLRFRLTGRLATDLSDASGSSLFDVAAGAWSSVLLERWGIDPRLMPEVLTATDVAGVVGPDAAAESGLPVGLPVVAGGSDSTVESFSIGLTDARSCKVRLGTSGAVSTVVDDISQPTTAYVWSFLRAGRWMLDTNTRACAAAVRWLRDTLYSEVEADEAAFAAIDADAAEVPVGADGLLFHPYLMGEDAPYWDPHLRASFQGLRAGHGRPQLARAVLEGTAFALRDAMTTLRRWSPGFERTVFTGGGTLSPTWLAIVADVLGRDGEVAETADASLGAAMLAGVGVGAFADLEASLERCYRVRQQVAHDAARAAAYDLLFEQYLRSRPTPPGRST